MKGKLSSEQIRDLLGFYYDRKRHESKGRIVRVETFKRLGIKDLDDLARWFGFRSWDEFKKWCGDRYKESLDRIMKMEGLLKVYKPLLDFL